MVQCVTLLLTHATRTNACYKIGDRTALSALLLAQKYHQRWEVGNTLDELKTHLKGRKTLIRSKSARRCGSENLWLAFKTLGDSLFNVSSGSTARLLAVALGIYRNPQNCVSSHRHLGTGRAVVSKTFGGFVSTAFCHSGLV